MTTQTLLIGENGYTITKAYREGAMANRNGTHYHDNPYDDGTQECYDWADGHTNEDEVPCPGLT